jgi:hypothetical protein
LTIYHLHSKDDDTIVTDCISQKNMKDDTSCRVAAATTRSSRRLQLSMSTILIVWGVYFIFQGLQAVEGQRTVANFGTRLKKRFGASKGDSRSNYILSQEGEDNNNNNNNNNTSIFQLIKDTTRERPGMLATAILLLVGYFYLMYYQQQTITNLEEKLKKQYRRQASAPGEFAVFLSVNKNGGKLFSTGIQQYLFTKKMWTTYLSIHLFVV